MDFGVRIPDYPIGPRSLLDVLTSLSPLSLIGTSYLIKE